MKKISILVMMSVALLFGSFVSPAVAEGKKDSAPGQAIAEAKKLEKVKKDLEKAMKGKKHSNVVDVSELPEDVGTIKFDSVEEFEKFLEQVESYREEAIAAEANEEAPGDALEYLPIDKNEFTIMASDIGRISWSTYHPLKIWLPSRMYIDYEYTYSGSGNTKKYTNVQKMTSYSSMVPSWWKQTTRAINFYDGYRTVQFKIQGYFVLGVEVKGFKVGMTFPDSYTKYDYIN